MAGELRCLPHGRFVRLICSSSAEVADSKKRRWTTKNPPLLFVLVGCRDGVFAALLCFPNDLCSLYQSSRRETEGHRNPCFGSGWYGLPFPGTTTFEHCPTGRHLLNQAGGCPGPRPRGRRGVGFRGERGGGVRKPCSFDRYRTTPLRACLGLRTMEFETLSCSLILAFHVEHGFQVCWAWGKLDQACFGGWCL